ncbi:MAG: hypothetical protein B6I18_09240 [Bacteroidetes bacterium 4572_112]|nr:MAG: hypothetical protein B6I18_09240 [Bacteroidetes bacterium 4572_112]
MSASFIDIHTHNALSDSQAGIQSFCIQDISFNQQWPSSFSVGIHPWHIHKVDVTQALKQLEYIACEKDMKAIGECGLDRAIARNFDLQLSAFISQIKIAEAFDKPMIIHNVRAFSDFLSILKNEKPAIPFVFHAFNGNKDILNKLMRFNVYFSIGADVLKDNSKALRILPFIPLNRLFIETDEWEGDIAELYQKISELKSIDVEKLKNQLYYNYKNIFA